MEEYRKIEGYEVSNLGNCKQETGIHTNGYREIKHSKHTYIHILVAKAFPEICGKWFDGAVVHHKDRNKLNNNADNLIVLTVEQHYEEHRNERVELGKILFKGKHHTEESRLSMSKSHTGKQLSDNHKKKIGDSLSKPVVELDMNNNYIKVWDKMKDACEFYNDFHISEVCRGKRKSAAKRKWKYLDE